MMLLANVIVLVCLICVHGFSMFKSGKGTNGVKAPLENLPKPCRKPPFVGVCHPLKEAWYYEQNSNCCKMLQPGTCAGGNNLFPTMKKCMKECMPLTPRNSRTCLQRPVEGTCAPLLVAWYFDTESSYCKMFNHTICGGGPNLFLTEMKCQQACLPKEKPKAYCSMAPTPGKCWGGKRHWYFDEKTNNCHLFAGKRCGKNNNAFSSYLKCMQRCSHRKAVACPTCTQIQQNELPAPQIPGSIGYPGVPSLPSQNDLPGAQSLPNLPSTQGKPGQPMLPSQNLSALPGQ
ncbi:tissue factor pathway inhibitor 2-like [Dermacentor andersoni]|uniref:tissue factor pathway inhibitor 2-like n=1 Tax=Dermacentor andersoni TaxID=34620 RepID=UPI003B3AEE2C